MPCLRRTTQKRISQISVTMQNDLKSSFAFSIALDESRDTQDNPQLAIFVQYVSSDCTIKDMVAPKETTRGNEKLMLSTKL